jgi:hypothetical protein
MAHSLRPASRAAYATVAICVSAAHPEHQHRCELPAFLKMKTRSVSTVTFVMRFAFFISFRANRGHRAANTNYRSLPNTPPIFLRVASGGRV